MQEDDKAEEDSSGNSSHRGKDEDDHSDTADESRCLFRSEELSSDETC